MEKRITLLFKEEEWNFLYKLQTIAFIASYTNPSAAPISDILKAMINDRPYKGNDKAEDPKLFEKIKREMKNDVDEEISRLSNLGYSKGNYVLNLYDYDLRSLDMHIKARGEKEKSKLTYSKMVKILVRENMENLSHSITVAANIYTGCIFGIGAYGFLILKNFYEDITDENMKKVAERPEIYTYYDQWIGETSRKIKTDADIMIDFFKLINEKGFPRDFNSFMEERKKYWSIVSYFNYVTAAAGFITSLRVLIYPTNWIPDFIYGSFSDRFPRLTNTAIAVFLLELFLLMQYASIGSYTFYKEENNELDVDVPEDVRSRDHTVLNELHKALEEYNNRVKGQ